jgi:hypothetical protein
MLKRLVHSRLAVIAGAALSLVLAFGVGWRSRDAAAEEALHSSELAHATLQLTRTTHLLTALRDGLVEPARDRLETHLDSAIIALGHHYSASRDTEGSATRALQNARAYRLAHPERFEHSPMREFVDPALAKLPQ